MLNKSNKQGIKKYTRNKRAQIGGTLTWFVATLIIIFILLIGIYASSLLGKTKFLEFNENIKGSDNSWEETKNTMAFEKDSSNKEIITNWINNKSLSEDS